jgi:hypothetical protein
VVIVAENSFEIAIRRADGSVQGKIERSFFAGNQNVLTMR